MIEKKVASALTRSLSSLLSNDLLFFRCNGHAAEDEEPTRRTTKQDASC